MTTSHGRFSLLEVQDMLLALGALGGTCHGPNMEFCTFCAVNNVVNFLWIDVTEKTSLKL